MNYLTSSFSLQMLPDGGYLKITRISRIRVGEWMDESRIGHEGTAKVLSRQLGVKLEVDRRPIILRVGDEVQVAQPISSRLSPGQEISEPELAYFLLQVLPAPKAKTLANFWDDELEEELKRRKARPRPVEAPSFLKSPKEIIKDIFGLGE